MNINSAIYEALNESIDAQDLSQYSRDPHGFQGWVKELSQMVNAGKLSWEDACMICLAAVDNCKYVDEIIYNLGFYNN